MRSFVVLKVCGWFNQVGCWFNVHSGSRSCFNTRDRGGTKRTVAEAEKPATCRSSRKSSESSRAGRSLFVCLFVFGCCEFLHYTHPKGTRNNPMIACVIAEDDDPNLQQP
jgi:hypothetical protein